MIKITRFDDARTHKVVFTLEIDIHVFTEYYLTLDPKHREIIKRDGPVSSCLAMLAVMVRWVEDKYLARVGDGNVSKGVNDD